jgi:hypothetical protein
MSILLSNQSLLTLSKKTESLNYAVGAKFW